MFSKACEYGIKATLFVAMQSLQERRVSLKEIAEEIDSPMAFTAKILQKLVKEHILGSVKGPNGGFKIAQEQLAKITLSQIVYAIDGDSIYRGCALGLPKCNEDKPCPMHDKFVDIRNNLSAMLEGTNLYELATGLETGLTWLKR
ncbi:Rrf2 family transcriptional regulator [Flavobacteriaceae bacterium F08102]|nr:Rrf2 family transcriptional regulator [Flavobacteriaceae bacterium F08102]